MKSIAIVAAIAGLASAIPQGVSSQLAPSESAPAGCSSDHPEYFMLTVQTLSSGMNKVSTTRFYYPSNTNIIYREQSTEATH